MSGTEKDPVSEVMKAFDEFKATNDANLKKHDTLLEDKLTKVNAFLDKFEPMNQQVTLAAQGQKSMQEQLDRVEAAMNRPKTGGDADGQDAEYKNAFEHCLRRSPDRRDAAQSEVINKRRNTLVRGDDAGAGYLLAPAEVVKEIIKDIIEMSPMRSLATVVSIGGPSLKYRRRTAAAGAAKRVGETELRTNTGDPAYGEVKIDADEMFARAEISTQMIEDSDYDLIGELRSEFVDQFAVKENTEFVSGTAAAHQAQGFLSEAAVGEAASGAADTLTADGLIRLWASLKTGYAPRSVFLMNRATIAKVRSLKDGEGQYIWTPGIAGSVPNTILGAGYIEFPDMPDIAAGSYPIAYGDFRRAYTIVDRVSLAFQPDYTTGADNGLVIFRARKRVGGGVRQADAIKKLKVAAA